MFAYGRAAHLKEQRADAEDVRCTNMINVAILTVNNAVSDGESMDFSGPAIRDCLPAETFHVKEHSVVPEDRAMVSAVVERWCKPESDVQLVITTGGTGISPSDVTPDAVSKLLHVEIPGIGEAIRMNGLPRSPRAMLSRGIAGIRNRTLVVSLTGNPDFARQAMQVILPALQHAVGMINSQAAA